MNKDEQREITFAYFNAFQDKNIGLISSFFEADASIEDWNVSLKGLDSLTLEIKNIFTAITINSIKVKCLHSMGLIQIAEISIDINESDPLNVIDVIEFSKNNKIKSIRAYKM